MALWGWPFGSHHENSTTRLFFLLAWHQNINFCHMETTNMARHKNGQTLAFCRCIYFQFKKKNIYIDFHSCEYRGYYSTICRYSNQCINPEFHTNSCSCPTDGSLVVWVGDGLGFDSRGTRGSQQSLLTRGSQAVKKRSSQTISALGFPACHGKIPGLRQLKTAQLLSWRELQPRPFEKLC